MQTIFLFLCVIVFGFFGCIWKRDRWLNVTFKLILLGMFIFSLFLLLLNRGYVVKL